MTSSPTPAVLPDARARTLAERFHEAYERLAPSYGYETRPDTKAFDPFSANGRLMIAVCGELTNPTPPASDAAVPAEQAVMVCPQCEGEGGYPDGIDDAACHTECTRCRGNGWIVDLVALAAAPKVASDTGQSDARAQSQAFWDAAQECLRVGEETEFAADVTEEYRKGYKAACKIMSMPLQHMSSRAARGLPWNGTPPASDAAVPAGAFPDGAKPLVYSSAPPKFADNEAVVPCGYEIWVHTTSPLLPTMEDAYAWAKRYVAAAAPKVASDTGAGLTGVERMARLWAWHQFGLKWEHLEKVSQAELLAACQAAFDWLNQPLSARQAALSTPTDATGDASKRVDDAADAILADVRGRRLLKLLFREDANTNATPVGWIDASIDLETQRECATAWARIALAAAPKRATGTEAASRIERVAQAIYEASGSLIDQNGFIPWSAVDGTTDADSYRRMAAAALSTPTDATDGATGGGEAGTGWVSWNPDSGEEYTPDHPVRSGECVEAERIRPSTPQEDVLWQAFQGEFERAHALETQLAATTPGGDLLEQAAFKRMHDWLRYEASAQEVGPVNDLHIDGDTWDHVFAPALKPAGDGGEA